MSRLCKSLIVVLVLALAAVQRNDMRQGKLWILMTALLGLVFLGGRYLGCYARVGSKDTWNTTIHSGGRYRAFDAPGEMVELAERAQSLFDLDFTTVDVAETANGPVVFEVSAFGGFRGAKEGIGIDAAARASAEACRSTAPPAASGPGSAPSARPRWHRAPTSSPKSRASTRRFVTPICLSPARGGPTSKRPGASCARYWRRRRKRPERMRR